MKEILFSPKLLSPTVCPLAFFFLSFPTFFAVFFLVSSKYYSLFTLFLKKSEIPRLRIKCMPYHSLMKPHRRYVRKTSCDKQQQQQQQQQKKTRRAAKGMVCNFSDRAIDKIVSAWFVTDTFALILAPVYDNSPSVDLVVTNAMTIYFCRWRFG